MLKQFKANLVVIGVDKDQTRRDFEVLDELCESSNDGRVYINPTHETIKDLFLSISNYKF